MAKMRNRQEKVLFALWIALCLPGILSATCSSKSNFSPAVKVSSQNSSPDGWTDCVHGFCREADICECNPCYSGPTCQDYVDRFGPRFLAEEPFFILNYEKVRKSAPPPLQPLTSSKFSESPLSTNSYYGNGRVQVPLFRIEAADDDLGLTCQLGEVGPSATCPCATPRYAVIGPSQKMFYMDAETGDVFLRDGFMLQPNTHYFIKLQVKALEVKGVVQKPWKEEILATIYVHSNESEETMTKSVLETYKSTELNLDESGDYSSLSPEEAENVYLSRFLPSTNRAKSSVTSRFKRQAREALEQIEDRFQITFPNASSLQTFTPGERIKLGILIEFPVSSSLHKVSGGNYSVEIVTKIQGVSLDVEISSGNLVQTGSLIKYPPCPIFTSTRARNAPDTVTWNFKNISSIWKEKDPERKNVLQFELTIYPYATSATRYSTGTGTREPNLRVEAQISFPLRVRNTLIKARAPKIKTFIQFPIKREIGEEKDISLSAVDGLCVVKKQLSLKPFSTLKRGQSTLRSPGIEVIGPPQLPMGSSGSFTIRVSVEDDFTWQLSVSLRQIGNPGKASTFVQDLQLIKTGEGFLPLHCPETILKHGFLLECSNLSYWKSGVEDGSEGESGNGASEPHNESDRRVLEFQGRVYTRPDARPGSTFRLQITADVIIGKSREGLMLMSSGSKDQDLVEEFMRDRAGATVTFVGKIVTGDKGELDRLSPPTPTPRRRKSIDLQLSLTNRSSNRTRSYKLKQIKRETPYSHL